MATIKKEKIVSCSKDVERLAASHISDGNENCVASIENSLVIPQ